MNYDSFVKQHTLSNIGLGSALDKFTPWQIGVIFPGKIEMDIFYVNLYGISIPIFWKK